MGKGSMHTLLGKTGLALAAMAAMTVPVLAGQGQPSPWQMGFQTPVTEVAKEIDSFHFWLFVLITIITLFVTVLLGYTVWRFREQANPEPSKTTHNVMLEVAWTIAPILILLMIAIPSFRLLYKQYDYPKPDVVIKATGNQWYWSYEYPDAGGMSFDSVMLEDDELKEPENKGKPRLLSTDNPVVVPVNKNIEVHVTAADVIHNWAVPSFGVRLDGVPGRLTRTWFRAEKTGVFYGQCSELCGVKHAFMPIEVHVVSQKDYEKWLVKAKEEFASKARIRTFAKVKAGKAVANLEAAH